MLDKSGVYELKCKNCNGVYIRETRRKLGIRIKEHKNDNKYSSMKKHLKQTRH